MVRPQFDEVLPVPPPGDLNPEELGFPGPQAKPVLHDGSPLGLGKFAIPQQLTFQGIINSINHVYPYTFDEAMLHSKENAERMRFDPVIDACLRIRMMSVGLLPWHFEADDPDNSGEIDAIDKSENLLKSVPGQLNMARSLLDAVFVGRSAWQNRWRWKTKRGKQWMYPTAEGRHIDGDKLVFGWGDEVGILVHASFSGPTRNTERGRAYFLTPEEREQLLVHKFEPTDASFYRPQGAGSIHGTGLRGKLYWLWSLKSRIWSLGVDFLEWFAQGLTAYYFQSGNDAHMREMKSWIEGQQGSKVILLPAHTAADGRPSFKPVERFEAGTASSQFLQALLTDYFDDLIVRLILGQTLMTQTASTGLGSGVAAAHNSVFDNIIKYDATALQETMSDQYLRVFYRHNYPGMEPARWVYDIDSPNVQQMIENAQAIWQMGGRVDEEALLDAAGLPIPGANSTILSNVQPMQPAAVGGTPEGVPIIQGQEGSPPQGPQQLRRVGRKLLGQDMNPLTRLQSMISTRPGLVARR